MKSIPVFGPTRKEGNRWQKKTIWWGMAWCVLLTKISWKIRWNENIDYVHLVQDRIQGLSLMNTDYSFVSTFGNVLIRWLKESAPWSRVACQSYISFWVLILKKSQYIYLAMPFMFCWVQYMQPKLEFLFIILVLWFIAMYSHLVFLEVKCFVIFS